MAFFEEMRAIAEGKLTCVCGNDDWREFIFVSGMGDSGVVAGCKRCAKTYRYRDGAWEAQP